MSFASSKSKHGASPILYHFRSPSKVAKMRSLSAISSIAELEAMPERSVAG